MSWSDAAPNFLIGLREGLEAGLVVSILLAAVRKTSAEGRRISSTPVWLGVLGAVMVAGSFAAVLTYSTTVLSSKAQEAIAGVLSVSAVGLVTGMVFWMRRTAAGLSARLRGEVARAAEIGAGALAITAFLAVGREGLETTLFLWTAIHASGQTVAPLVGAGLGLAAALLLCALLYRRAVRLNLAVFFHWTAIALIVIAAGVLAYGLGDLQDGGLLPGVQWVAVDLTGHIDPNSWWASIVSGLTELTPKMTVLQVTAWVAYLVVVIPLFVQARDLAPAALGPTIPTPAPRRELAPPQRWERLVGRRPRLTAGVFVLVPVVTAGIAIAVLPTASAAATTAVTVTRTTCADDWTDGHTGTQTITVNNQSGQAGEINLDNASGDVVAEIETIGPATAADMTATLGPGAYTIQCIFAGQKVTSSPPVSVSGVIKTAAPAAVAPVTVEDLTPATNAYLAYAAGALAYLAADVGTLRSDLERDRAAAAKVDWLAAQLDWERVGASYDSFGDLGVAIDGLPDGLPGGVTDKDFTGLHRIEYGLWHGQSPKALIPVAVRLARDVAALRNDLGSDDIAGDPTNLPIRAHEILEDAVRDHLSGIDDQGAGAAYPQTRADLEVTRVVLGELAPLITARAPSLLRTARVQINTLRSALVATRAQGRWRSLQETPLIARQRVNAAISALLQTLSSVPDLLEVSPSH
jgi:high-affinity iron transporter